MKEIQVTPGQIWQDLDPRRAGRRFQIKSVNNGYALCKNAEKGTVSRISVNQFKSENRHRYNLVGGNATAQPQAPQELLVQVPAQAAAAITQ